jgi:hypothetical protein
VFNTLFSRTGFEKPAPHSVFVKLKPTLVDEVHTAISCQPFDPDQVINSNEHAANNSVRPHYGLGKEIIDLTLDQIRKHAKR